MSDAKNNRAAMPQVASLVDELRAQGLEVRVLYAKEGGKEVGKRPEYREVFTIPKGYGMPTGGKTK